MTTLSEIVASEREFLTAEDISDFIEADPQCIRTQARTNPQLLGFPVIVCGTRVRIPRRAFVSFITGTAWPTTILD